MRVPLSLIILTVLVMLMGGISAKSNEVSAPDAPSGSMNESQEDLDMAAKLNAAETEEGEIVEEDTMDLPAWEKAVSEEVEGKIDLEHLWKDPGKNAKLLYRLSLAILRSRTVPVGKGKDPEIVWQRCGNEVPKDLEVRQAGEWAFTFLAALERVESETGVKLPVWGAFATHANEGGFDECALDFPSRKWASEFEALRLIENTWKGKTVRLKRPVKLVDKFRLSYDRETVWKIIQDSYYSTATTTMPNGKKVKIAGRSDLGSWQLRTSVKNLTRARFDRQTSMISGIYMGAKEMARRAMAFSYRFRVKEPHPRPWMLWPGWNPYNPKALAYDVKIIGIARWLGARKEEIDRGYVIIDTTRKKPRYKIEKTLIPTTTL